MNELSGYYKTNTTSFLSYVEAKSKEKEMDMNVKGN
jgi:hypothetical protein